jgi:hypothetical protein
VEQLFGLWIRPTGAGVVVDAPVLSQFKGEDVHRLYREKVQKYSGQERRLWEDLRHGLFLGSKRFVARLRKRYLPQRDDKEIAGHRQSAGSLDPGEIADRAARLLGCNIAEFKNLGQAFGVQKAKRDLIIYFIWQSGLLTNEKIGAMFDLTYSAVSHSVRAVKAGLAADDKFRECFESLNSQFKV